MKLLIFLMLSALYGENKNTDLPVFILDSVVVKAKKQNIHAIYNIPHSVIRLKKISFSEDAFNIIPSLTFEYTAKGYGIVHFRGTGIKNLTLALDGIPMSIPYSGMFDISQIPSGFINSISVIPPSAPILAGKDAIGGIININSLNIKKTRHFSISTGSGKLFKNYAFVGDTGKHLSYIIGYAYTRCDGFTLSQDNPYGINGLLPNSYFIKRGILSKFRINTKAGITRLNAIYLDNEKGVPPMQNTKRQRYWRFPVWKRMTLMLRHKWKSMRVGLYHDKYYNILDAYDDSTYTTQNAPYAFHSTYDDFSDGGYIRSSNTIHGWDFTGIVSFRKDVHKEQPDYDEKWKRLDAFSQDLGIYAKKSFSKSTLLLSTEFLRHSQGPHKNLAPQFTASFSKVFKRFSGSISVSRRVRFPTLKEMYSTYSGSAYPNPDLVPEVSYNIDVKNTFKCMDNTFYIGLFYSYTNNLIQKILIDSLYKTVNLESSYSRGIEGGIKGIVGNISYNIFGSYNKARDNEKRPLDLIPESKGGIILSKPFIFKTILYSDVLYTSKRYQATKDTVYTLPAYTLVNLTLKKRYKNLILYLKVNNLFDNFYEYEHGIPGRGRYTEGGIELEF